MASSSMCLDGCAHQDPSQQSRHTMKRLAYASFATLLLVFSFTSFSADTSSRPTGVTAEEWFPWSFSILAQSSTGGWTSHGMNWVILSIAGLLGIVAGALLFGEAMSPLKLLSMALIMAGIAGLKLASAA